MNTALRTIDDLDPATDDPHGLADLAAADEVTLPGKRCTVNLIGGQQLEVRITNHCYLAWDKTAPRKKWGAMDAVPFLAGTFMAWIAAKREGKTSMGWEEWQEAVEDITTQSDEPEDLARPTRSAPGPGTS